MHRMKPGLMVVTAILVITAVAHLVTTASLEQRIGKEVRVRVVRAEQQLIQNASLEGLKLLKQVEALAADPLFAQGLGAQGEERSRSASLGFRRFVRALGPGEAKPDILALTDAAGDLVMLLDVDDPLPQAWKDGEVLKYPALELALAQRTSTSEIWDFDKQGLMKVGAAPIIAADTDAVVGAVVVAYAITARVARAQQSLLGANVVYFHDERVFATSFPPSAGEDNPQLQSQLARALATDELGKTALSQDLALELVEATLSGDTYIATAARLPRFSSQPLPEGYPPSRVGAMVMMSLPAALAPLNVVQIAILLVGGTAFLLAVLGVVIASRRILHQAYAIEDAIVDIVNGNLDRCIRPMGAELDGLAHALNVMLARLLGRPEPGDEVVDENGNLVNNDVVTFDDEDEMSPADSAALALAQEPEPNYYGRLYNEYIQARERVGESIAGISYDNFVTKLRFNESNLKTRYRCSAVRFRVVVRDHKVTLKPVPIMSQTA